MSRSKRARFNANAWLFGLGVPVISLFALFSLLPYSAIMARWPMGVGDREKEVFQKWFDQRPSDTPDTVKTEVYQIAAIGDAPCALDGGDEGKEVDQLLTAEGFSDTVHVRNDPSGGVVLRMQTGSLFRGHGELALHPATIKDIASKYMEVIAAELEVPSPTVSFVQVQACGKDRGVFLTSGLIGDTYLKRNHMAQRAMVRMPLSAMDNSEVAVTGDASAAMNDAVQQRLAATVSASSLDQLAEIMDVPRFASLVLLSHVRDGKNAGDASVLMTYDAGEGMFHPLFDPGYRSDAPADKDVVQRGLGALLAQPAFVELVNGLAQKAKSDPEEMQQRLDLVDRTWLPILAQGKPVGMVEAEAQGIRAAMLERLWNPDLAESFGAIRPAEASERTDGLTGTTLDPWLDQFREQGDTLRFIRGKYTIDHDLILPKGFSLVLEKGTRFFIAPGKNIVVHGTLIARGTGLNPVFIRPLEPGVPYGTVAVMGDGRTRNALRGVQMSGGMGAWVNGMHFEGMLCSHRADLSLESCDLEGGTVSVSHGALAVKGSRLTGQADGGVLVAYGSGLLKDCVFAGATSWDSTMIATDHAMVRSLASKVLITNCRFTDLAATGVRANEAAQVFIGQSTFERVALPVRAFDLSVVHVSGNTFNKNGVLFTGRCADPVFGGAYFTIYENMLEGNQKDRDLDQASSLVRKGSVDETVRKAFGLDKPLEDSAQGSIKKGRRRGN